MYITIIEGVCFSKSLEKSTDQMERKQKWEIKIQNLDKIFILTHNIRYSKLIVFLGTGLLFKKNLLTVFK